MKKQLALANNNEFVYNSSHTTSILFSTQNGQSIYIDIPKLFYCNGNTFPVIPLGFVDDDEYYFINYSRHCMDANGTIYNNNISPYPYKSSQKMDGSQRVKLATKHTYYDITKSDSKKIHDIAKSLLKDFRGDLLNNIFNKLQDHNPNKERDYYKIETPIGTYHAFSTEDKNLQIDTIEGDIKSKGIEDYNILVFKLENNYRG